MLAFPADNANKQSYPSVLSLFLDHGCHSEHCSRYESTAHKDRTVEPFLIYCSPLFTAFQAFRFLPPHPSRSSSPGVPNHSRTAPLPRKRNPTAIGAVGPPPFVDLRTAPDLSHTLFDQARPTAIRRLEA